MEMENTATRINNPKENLSSLYSTFRVNNKLANLVSELHLGRYKKQGDQKMNGRVLKLAYDRFLRLSNVCLLMIGVETVLCFTYYELDHIENSQPERLLFCAYILHCLEVFLRLVIEKVRDSRMQIIQKLDYNFKWEIAKILISFPLYPLPWLHHTTLEVGFTQSQGNQDQYPFKVNYLIIIFSIFHSIMVALNTLILNTAYYSPRSQRISKIYEVHHHGTLYAVKCIIKDYPIYTLALISCIMWIYTTLAIRIAEADVPVSGNMFKYYQNCFWFIGITTTTVGYGDISPVSTLGYIIVCFCCIWSTFITSVVVFLLVTNLTLKKQQQKALQILKNVDYTLSRKKVCGRYINSAIRRLWLNKKYEMNLVQTLHQKKLKMQSSNMRKMKKKSINMNDLTHQMQSQFDNAIINVNYLQENNKNILDYIAKTYFVSDGSFLFNCVKAQMEQMEANECSIKGFSSSVISMVSVQKSCQSLPKSVKSKQSIEKQAKPHKTSIELGMNFQPQQQQQQQQQQRQQQKKSRFYEQSMSSAKEKEPSVLSVKSFSEN